MARIAGEQHFGVASVTSAGRFVAAVLARRVELAQDDSRTPMVDSFDLAPQVLDRELALAKRADSIPRDLS